MLFFFSFVASIFKCSFCLSPRLSHIVSFLIFLYFLNYSFLLYHRGCHPLFFFFCYPLFYMFFFFSSLMLSRINFFLFLSFPLELHFVNFDFLFTEDLTLLRSGFSSSWAITNFFFFSSFWRIDWLQKLSLAEMIPVRDPFSYNKEI